MPRRPVSLRAPRGSVAHVRGADPAPELSAALRQIPEAMRTRSSRRAEFVAADGADGRRP